jgi:hypothetical protein
MSSGQFMHYTWIRILAIAEYALYRNRAASRSGCWTPELPAELILSNE